MTSLEFLSLYPRTFVIIIGSLVTLISTILVRYFTDQEHIKSLKARQKELQKELKEIRKEGESDKLMEINKEIMELTMKLMKASFSFKQMLITIVPFLLLFQWMKGFYGGEAEILSSWFWYYLGAAIISSSFYRKLLKMA